jgi:serine/threonine protein phosphatase PrpC
VTQGTVAVAVVSDGHGSPRHFRSQIGSSLAVSTVAATLQAFLRDSVSTNGQVPFVPEQVHELERKIVSGWLAAVQSDLEGNPFTEAELATLGQEEGAEGRAAVAHSPELAYGATLLAAAATDRVLLYLQLGDGEILSVTSQGTTTRPLPPDDRLIANQTTSLCQPEAWKDFRSAWVTNGALPSLVLLSTDGYANSFRSDEDFLKIGQDYLDIIREQGISSLAEELPDILTEATQQGSGDDITLAILQDDLGAAAGAAKVPKPLMTPASKSALIEQLKARHSSQQHKLQELAVSVEHTRRDDRRLRNVLLVLVTAVIAIVVAVFHSRIFPPSPRPPLPPVTEPAPVNKKPVAATVLKPLTEAWTLQLNGKEIPLSKGVNIPSNLVHPEAKAGEYPKEYAQVAWDPDKHAMVLINGSTDKWSASNGQKANVNEEIKLGQKPLTISFTPKIKGTLAPAGEAAAGSESQ